MSTLEVFLADQGLVISCFLSFSSLLAGPNYSDGFALLSPPLKLPRGLDALCPGHDDEETKHQHSRGALRPSFAKTLTLPGRRAGCSLTSMVPVGKNCEGRAHRPQVQGQGPHDLTVLRKMLPSESTFASTPFRSAAEVSRDILACTNGGQLDRQDQRVIMDLDRRVSVFSETRQNCAWKLAPSNRRAARFIETEPKACTISHPFPDSWAEP